MTKFNQKQLDALGTAVTLAREGIGLQNSAEREAERETCDGLVASGHLIAIAD